MALPSCFKPEVTYFLYVTKDACKQTAKLFVADFTRCDYLEGNVGLHAPFLVSLPTTTSESEAK
jgi:hypothetical protein